MAGTNPSPSSPLFQAHPGLLLPRTSLVHVYRVQWMKQVIYSTNPAPGYRLKADHRPEIGADDLLAVWLPLPAVETTLPLAKESAPAPHPAAATAVSFSGMQLSP